MSPEQNKAIVRRFITEVLTGRNIGLVDELVAPNYMNRAMNLDLAGFKAMGAGLGGAVPDLRFEIEKLVAEGDAFVPGFSMIQAGARGVAAEYCNLTYRKAT